VEVLVSSDGIEEVEVPVSSDVVEEVEVRIPEALGFHH
jgi:hypothetical protein